MFQNEHICTVQACNPKRWQAEMAHLPQGLVFFLRSHRRSPFDGSLGHNMSDFSQMVEISSHNKYQPHHKNSGIDRKASTVFQTLKKLHPNTVVCDFQYFNSMSACRLASEGIAYVETVRHRPLWNLFDTLRNFVGLYPSSNMWVCLELAYRQMAIYL
jgi:hypothetical protein